MSANTVPSVRSQSADDEPANPDFGPPTVAVLMQWDGTREPVSWTAEEFRQVFKTFHTYLIPTAAGTPTEATESDAECFRIWRQHEHQGLLWKDAWSSPELTPLRERLRELKEGAIGYCTRLTRIQACLSQTLLQSGRELLTQKGVEGRFIHGILVASVGSREAEDLIDPFHLLRNELSLLSNLRPPEHSEGDESKSRLFFGPRWSGSEGSAYEPEIRCKIVHGHREDATALSALKVLQHLYWQARTEDSDVYDGLAAIERGQRQIFCLTSSVRRTASDRQQMEACIRKTSVKFLNDTLASWESEDPGKQGITRFVEVCEL